MQNSFSLRLFIVIIGVFTASFVFDSFRANAAHVNNSIERAAKDFSRLEQLINSYRSIERPSTSDPSKQLIGSLPIPPDVVQEAQAASDEAESLGCEISVVEKPKVELKFGDQPIEIVPFEVSYKGQFCPIDLKATMEVNQAPNDTNAFDIQTRIDFNLRDPKLKDRFGFEHATGGQDGRIKVALSGTSQHLEIALTNKMMSEGGVDGKVEVSQSLALTLDFQFPFNLKMAGEDAHHFLINGKESNLRRKQSLVGFTPQAEFWIDESPTDQKTFEKALQGMQFFGVGEKEGASNGSLSCTYSMIDASKVTANEIAQFQDSGTLPSVATDWTGKACGKNKTEAWGPYSIQTSFEKNWMLLTISGNSSASSTVYFLYDDDSYFVRQIDGYAAFMACTPVKKCSPTP